MKQSISFLSLHVWLLRHLDQNKWYFLWTTSSPPSGTLDDTSLLRWYWFAAENLPNQDCVGPLPIWICLDCLSAKPIWNPPAGVQHMRRTGEALHIHSCWWIWILLFWTLWMLSPRSPAGLGMSWIMTRGNTSPFMWACSSVTVSLCAALKLIELLVLQLNQQLYCLYYTCAFGDWVILTFSGWNTDVNVDLSVGLPVLLDVGALLSACFKSAGPPFSQVDKLRISYLCDTALGLLTLIPWAVCRWSPHLLCHWSLFCVLYHFVVSLGAPYGFGEGTDKPSPSVMIPQDELHRGG